VDLRAPVLDFSSKHYLAGTVVHHRDASDSAARIYLQPEEFSMSLLDDAPENERERTAAQDRGLPRRQQLASDSRVARGEGLSRCVQDEYRHFCHLLS
jgi:hypothetical protein